MNETKISLHFSQVPIKLRIFPLFNRFLVMILSNISWVVVSLLVSINPRECPPDEGFILWFPQAFDFVVPQRVYLMKVL